MGAAAVTEPNRPRPRLVQPPAHDLDAEAAVLSTLMLDAPKLAIVAPLVSPHDFYASANRYIAEAIWALSTEGGAVDVTTVAARLKALGKLEAVGGTPYLAQITDATPAVAHVDAHARIVAENARRRRLLASLKVTLAEAQNGATLDTLVARCRDAANDASNGRPSGLARISVDEIFAPLPPIEWTVRGLDFCAGAPHLIAGYGFTGKTVAAQSLALAVATGGKVWGTFDARPGRVLHLDYEQGRRLTLERYQRLAAASMLSPDELGNRLSVACLPSIYLDSANAEAVLSRECEGHALLIVDPLRAAAPTLEENDSGARFVLDLLARVSERTGVVALVLHHARKPQKDAAGGAKTAIRGSGALFDACASVLVFEADKGEPTLVQHEKARTSGRLAGDFLLRIEDVDVDGNPRGGLSVTAVGAPSPAAAGSAKIAATAPVVLEVIRKHPGCTTRRLREECAGIRAELVDVAAEYLAEQGHVDIKPGPRGSRLHFPKGGS